MRTFLRLGAALALGASSLRGRLVQHLEGVVVLWRRRRLRRLSRPRILSDGLAHLSLHQEALVIRVRIPLRALHELELEAQAGGLVAHGQDVSVLEPAGHVAQQLGPQRSVGGELVLLHALLAVLEVEGLAVDEAGLEDAELWGEHLLAEGAQRPRPQVQRHLHARPLAHVAARSGRLRRLWKQQPSALALHRRELPQVHVARGRQLAAKHLDGLQHDEAADDRVGGCNGVDDVARHALGSKQALPRDAVVLAAQQRGCGNKLDGERIVLVEGERRTCVALLQHRQARQGEQEDGLRLVAAPQRVLVAQAQAGARAGGGCAD